MDPSKIPYAASLQPSTDSSRRDVLEFRAIESNVAGYKMWVDEMDPNRLWVAAENSDVLPPLVVRATAITEIGEVLMADAAIGFALHCLENDGGLAKIARFLEEMLRGELILQRLKGGLPGPKPVTAAFGPLPKLERLIPQLDSAGVRMVSAHREYWAKGIVDPWELGYLTQLAHIGRQTTWAGAAPADKLAEYSGLTRLRQMFEEPAAVEPDSIEPGNIKVIQRPPPSRFLLLAGIVGAGIGALLMGLLNR